MTLWVLMHTYPYNPCGKPALKSVRKPTKMDVISPEIIRNIDGSIPLPTDPIVCQSCGEPICEINADDFIEDLS